MSIREERDHVVGTLQSEKNLEAKGDRVSMGGGGKDVLRKVPVGDYCAHKQLRFAVKTDSVMEVVALLQQEGIQSVPVLDVQKQKHFAFADVLDVLVHTLAVYDEWKATAMDDAAVQQRFSSLDAASLAGLSGQSPFQTISSNTPTSIAIDKFSKFRVRRLPIVDDDGKVIMVLSQFGVLEFLHSHAGAFASCSRSVEHYQLGYKAVHSVKEVDTVIDAFRLMLKANVSGVALVNNLGEVVGGMSTTDIKRIFHDGRVDLEMLDQYIVEFKHHSFKEDKHVSKTLVSVPPTATVGEALEKFISTRVHRLFVMKPSDAGASDPIGSGEGQVCGIISPIDILQLLNHEH